MKNIIRKYNRNRKIIWFILGIIIAIVSIIHIIDSSLGEHELNYLQPKKYNDNYYDISYSVISSETIDKPTNDDVTGTIKNFINYCNEGNCEGAYSLLSSECKEVLYPTLEQFKNDYYSINFNERKTYNLQSWIVYNNKFTYMVDLTQDMLVTGTSLNAVKRDYITVVKEQGENKINVSGFIEKNIINASKKVDSIDVLIESEEVFIDYLNLNITVNNNTYKNILLDSGASGSTVYLKDINDMTYVSYLYEVNNNELSIRKNSSKNFKIKFAKSFKENANITQVNFLDVILDYDNDNKKITKISIDF